MRREKKVWKEAKRRETGWAQAEKKRPAREDERKR